MPHRSITASKRSEHAVSAEREIIADYKDHIVGERELTDWTRADGVYRDVPIVYLRRVTFEDYTQQHGHLPSWPQPPETMFFWEVSMD